MSKLNENFIKAKEYIASLKNPSKDGDPGLPKGQTLTYGFPVLDLGVRPNISKDKWSIKVYGNVENIIDIRYEDLIKMPYVDIDEDFHCVTHWSKKNVLWRGVKFNYIQNLVKPLSDTRFVLQEGYDSYTTNLPIDAMVKDNVILAYKLFGEDIPTLHGGLVRMIVPSRYGWKGSKFLSGINFLKEDRPGFWEVRGYNNNGDFLKEERYS